MPLVSLPFSVLVDINHHYSNPKEGGFLPVCPGLHPLLPQEMAAHSLNPLWDATLTTPTDQMDQQVWLSTQDLTLQLEFKKMIPELIGPFTVRKVITPV